MIVVRVARGIREHFPARASEWGFAWLLIYCGWLFWNRPDMFASSLAYAGLARMADEQAWSLGCVTVGSLRLLALIVNGTFAATWYGRWSAHVRGACAFLSCGVWFPLFFGLLPTGRPLGLLHGYVAIVLLIDFYNIRRVWSDAGAGDRSLNAD